MTIIDRQAQTSAERSTHENSVRDIVGIGIGPGNLGLAVAESVRFFVCGGLVYK